MNRKMNYKHLSGVSLAIFLLISILIMPINFGYASGDSTIEDIENTCGTPVNVKDSLIMSIVTICVPGILEKVKDWREISCEAAVCKYNAIKGGIDPSFCEKQKEYKFCKFIWGEVFSVPPLTIIEMYKDMIKELIANPIGIIYGYATKVARNYITTNCPGASCQGPIIGSVAAGLFVVDLTGTLQTLEDMSTNGFDGKKNQQNFCEQAKDIKVELEEIIETYKEIQKLGGEE